MHSYEIRYHYVILLLVPEDKRPAAEAVPPTTP